MSLQRSRVEGRDAAEGPRNALLAQIRIALIPEPREREPETLVFGDPHVEVPRRSVAWSHHELGAMNRFPVSGSCNPQVPDRLAVAGCEKTLRPAGETPDDLVTRTRQSRDQRVIAIDLLDENVLAPFLGQQALRPDGLRDHVVLADRKERTDSLQHDRRAIERGREPARAIDCWSGSRRGAHYAGAPRISGAISIRRRCRDCRPSKTTRPKLRRPPPRYRSDPPARRSR